MQLLRDNLTLWTSDLSEAQGNNAAAAAAPEKQEDTTPAVPAAGEEAEAQA